MRELENYLEMIAEGVAQRAQTVAIMEAFPPVMLVEFFTGSGEFADTTRDETMRRLEAAHRQAADSMADWRAAVAAARRRVEELLLTKGGKS